MITVNMTKAKEITKTRLRTEREPLLAELDIAYQRADESGNTVLKTEIATQKQVLRDITQLADTATTLEELKSITVE
jgi:hypothetical protein